MAIPGSVRVLALACCCQLAAAADMTFFITSRGPGNGGDLGGLAGADAHCQALATAAGAGQRQWRAYLSTQATEGQPAVNARDRIGKGPWANYKGVVIAADVDELHGTNKISGETAMTEKGGWVPGRGDRGQNNHDIMTGSNEQGRAYGGERDRTCKNWTSSGEGSAQVGHHDRQGTGSDPRSASWNSAHSSRSCSAGGLRETGGAGLFYCFAAD
ncbi:hypothetical protein [Ramlibacter albus]|uniref:Lectin n=1 Tax=Ramlibacter albus TaxID=2079448 RepID=A0A923M9U5_9BURK|nr:hypothetical protein [Ramlibacter albus]MBC5765414.1 hypothetical protein [Ramlibacter albus]